MAEQASPDILRYSPDQVNELFSSGKARLIASKKESPESTGDLVKSESEAWRTFLGKDIDVPPVPQELLDAQQKAQEKGITSLEAHYLPAMKLGTRGGKGGKIPVKPVDAPGWTTKPNDWFWEQATDGKVDDSAFSLDGNWVLIDKTPKPQYDNGRQSYESDTLTALMARLRDEDKIEGSSTPASRFSTSWNELDGKVLPELAHDLGVRDDQVRLPKAIEFNVLGNMHHKEWGETTTWEWFEDKFESDGRLIGGGSDGGGLARVRWLQPDGRDDGLGFRPLIVFPS